MMMLDLLHSNDAGAKTRTYDVYIECSNTTGTHCINIHHLDIWNLRLDVCKRKCHGDTTDKKTEANNDDVGGIGAYYVSGCDIYIQYA